MTHVHTNDGYRYITIRFKDDKGFSKKINMAFMVFMIILFALFNTYYWSAYLLRDMHARSDSLLIYSTILICLSKITLDECCLVLIEMTSIHSTYIYVSL
jgi:hypothetical protein